MRERERHAVALVAARLLGGHERRVLLRCCCRGGELAALLPAQVEEVDWNVERKQAVCNESKHRRVSAQLLDALHHEAGGHPDDCHCHNEGQA